MANQYYRKILILFTGTGLAQLINLAGLPLLTRLYGPEHFGLFAFYTAFVAILTLLATLKFENHILLSRSQSGITHSTNLVKMTAILAGVAVFIVSYFLKPYFEFEEGIFVWVSLGVVVAGWQLANSHLLNRLGRYKIMSQSRVLAAIVFLSTAVLFSVVMENPANGLLWSSILGVLSSVLYSSFNGATRRLNIRKSFQLLSQEPSYYRVTLPSSLLDVMSNQVPLIFSKGVFSLDKVGNYGLYNKCVSLPSSILGKSVASVFKQEAFKSLNQNKPVDALYLDTAKKMLMIGFVPYLLIQFAGVELFTLIFGVEWAFAGEIASVMALRFYLGFVISPLSSILYFAHYKKWDFLIQISLMVAILFTLYFSYLHKDFMLMITGLTISYVCKYLVQFFVGYWVAKNGSEVTK